MKKITIKLKSLKQVVSDLPELYQEVFGHEGEFLQASRKDRNRLKNVKNIYKILSIKLGRDMRVLDLGCAQGYFSFNLAKMGAEVVGIDYEQNNINLCNFLKSENKSLKVSFTHTDIEDFITASNLRKFDLVLGLSVFHHLSHQRGFEYTQQLLSTISNQVNAGVFEFALSSEPLFWASSLPKHTIRHLDSFCFFKLLGQTKTHLSNIKRPMLYASNRYLISDGEIEKITKFTHDSHHLVFNNFQKTRRYITGEKSFHKIYDLSVEGLRKINLNEFKNEVKVSSLIKDEFPQATINEYSKQTEYCWLSKTKHDGTLLSEVILKHEQYNAEAILESVLSQLVQLEKRGLYHNDLRTWNVMMSDGKPIIIDFGAVSSSTTDCAWPENIYYSFLIFIHELFQGEIVKPLPFRLMKFDLSTLPVKYQSFVDTILKSSNKLSFRNIYDLLENQSHHDDSVSNYSSLVSTLAYRLKAEYKKHIKEADRLSELEIEVPELNSQLLNLQSELEKSNLLLGECHHNLQRITTTKMWRFAEKLRFIKNLVLK